MTDGQISRGVVLAYGLWGVVALLIGFMWIAAIAGSPTLVTAFGITGAATSAVAATAHIRKFFCEHDEAMHNAFELGRDSVHPVR